jgi:hypothetical protein
MATMPAMQEGVSSEAQQLQALLPKPLIGAATHSTPISSNHIRICDTTPTLSSYIMSHDTTHTSTSHNITPLEATVVVAILIEFNKVYNTK